MIFSTDRNSKPKGVCISRGSSEIRDKAVLIHVRHMARGGSSLYANITFPPDGLMKKNDTSVGKGGGETEYSRSVEGMNGHNPSGG